ncbi:MAG: hypothetical protein ACE5DS_03570, partial [Kiloniellaceae bacterium]
MAPEHANGGADLPMDGPDIAVSVRQTFGIDSDMQVPAFSQPNEYVPLLDEVYRDFRSGPVGTG